MLAIPFWTRRKVDALINSLAQEIADACLRAVRTRVEGRCSGMSPSEVRGYVRARAAGPIRSRASERLKSIRDMSCHDSGVVMERATDRVVLLLAGEIASMNRATVMYRRAA
jgi:hypothetical protein